MRKPCSAPTAKIWRDFRVTIPKQVRQNLGVKTGDWIYLINRKGIVYLTSDYQIALNRLKDRNDPIISEAELLRRLRLRKVSHG